MFVGSCPMCAALVSLTPCEISLELLGHTKTFHIRSAKQVQRTSHNSQRTFNNADLSTVAGGGLLLTALSRQCWRCGRCGRRLSYHVPGGIQLRLHFLQLHPLRARQLLAHFEGPVSY